MIAYPVKFQAIHQERIWGGDQLKPWFHVDQAGPIGEYWVVSGHPSATSVVTNGPLRGKTLVDLTNEYPLDYLGDSAQERFPLLVKFLEAKADLSVQIHPDDDYAKAHEKDYGKTEAWYVLDCARDGLVNYGHRFRSRDDYMAAVQQGTVRDALRYRPIEKGDIVFVPSRTLHALLANTVVIEVQQTSDVTYRVYDWDRVDENGRSRELHIEKAADVLRYDESDVVPLEETTTRTIVNRPGVTHLERVRCPYFTMDEVRLSGDELSRGGLSTNAYEMRLGRQGNPDVLVIAAGSGELTYNGANSTARAAETTLALQRGDAVLIPSSIDTYTLSTSQGLTLLRTYY